METLDIDKTVEQTHAKLKADFHKQMSEWRFFRELDEFAQNMIVLEMIDKYNEGQRTGWLDGFTKGIKE
jgi:hypothetical protein